ncbi:MAG TPA: S41 family peptidase [Gemmatimonadaceae bacterium]|nr:S41 family peptidase [Gemmatimonadaceae bacterium]
MRSRAMVVAALFAGALVTGGAMMERGLGGTAGGRAKPVDGARLFDDVVRHVERQYVDPVPPESLYFKAVTGMLRELRDPHTVYLAADRARRLTETTAGRYGGVGVQIEPRDGGIVVIAPLPGTPADSAGLRTGDRILEIDGRATRGLTGDEAQRALRGAAGSRVGLLVERPGIADRLTMTLVRREIRRHAVSHTRMLGDGVGYVDLDVFNEATAAELRAAVERLQREGMRALVLDLRGNPGGLLDQGVAAADLFLDSGNPIVATRGRARGTTQEFTDGGPQRWPTLAMVVLVDSGSASAAEIVAGALQDHDRAALVGTATFGKGSAQSLFPIDGGALKLTTARWFTPSGRSIDRPAPRDDDDEGDDGTPSARTATFRTTGGRIVYGGGGITPDVVVADTTLPAAELALQRALGANVPAFQDVVAELATALRTSGAVSAPDFVVTEAMRRQLRSRLAARRVSVDSATFERARPYVDRALGYQVARYAFGADAQFWRVLRDDRMVAVARSLLEGTPTGPELLRRAAARASAAPQRPAAEGTARP